MASHKTTSLCGFTQCILVGIICLLPLLPVSAQVTGEDIVPAPTTPAAGDTAMVFVSPRPLLSSQSQSGALRDAWGVDVLFSGNGFGLGAFYYSEFSPTVFGFVHLGISGVQSTDEFEEYDPRQQQWVVPDKLNRLFVFPLTAGVQYRLFKDEVSDNFRPFLQAGIGPSFIMSTPYSREFFSAFGDAQFHVRPGGFVGVGMYFGDAQKTLTGAHLRYYYIPFGGDGLASVKNFPIQNFGGIFLSLSMGFL